jgi:outer membrane protein assembly factor BamD (BamD/ComL family)
MKRMYWIAGLALVMIASLLIGCAGTPSQEELSKRLEAAQENQDPTAAVETYRQIIQYYPESEQAAKAQFMMGYIYANELADTANARKAYIAFLENYSDSTDTTLVISAKIELETLGEDDLGFAKHVLGEDVEGEKE